MEEQIVIVLFVLLLIGAIGGLVWHVNSERAKVAVPEKKITSKKKLEKQKRKTRGQGPLE
jgi:cell division protein FtsL